MAAQDPAFSSDVPKRKTVMNYERDAKSISFIPGFGTEIPGFSVLSGKLDLLISLGGRCRHMPAPYS